MRVRAVVDLPGSEVIRSAQAGDPRAVERFVTGCLPLLYNVVGRAMNGRGDVDDVVQETVLRALDGLPRLRDPERLRSWLVAIAIRQVRSWWHHDQRREKVGLPEDVDNLADRRLDFADLTILRLELSGQREEAVRATRWLDDEEREVLALWWLEVAGELTRADVVAACDEPAQHVAVRIQRVKQRLDTARAVARALAAVPRCRELAEEARSWDGTPSARWRKRLGRHVRSCGQCTSDLMPLEGLVGNLALVPLPIGLAGLVLHQLASTAATGAAAATTSAAATAGGVSLKALAAAAAAAVTTVAAIVVHHYTQPTESEERQVALSTVHTPPGSDAGTRAAPESTTVGRTTVTPADLPPTTSPVSSQGRPTDAQPAQVRTSGKALALGRFSLRAASGERYLHRNPWNKYAAMGEISADSDATARQEATFTVVSGLADPACYSFRAPDGDYLRHYVMRVEIGPDDGTTQFAEDSTFCAHPGHGEQAVALEPINFPGHLLRGRPDAEVWIDHGEATGESSFFVVDPLG
ncbi:sigma-70 family RNA polymerase sigma factor [Saccharothrix hoggarensis]|uniref:RNA polymerase sigma factor n=1 Tax=Saccharothrix hoggarensis TaxID=913853 RepID=A0ABW3QPU3_9PSEU